MAALSASVACAAGPTAPPELRRWLGPQDWERDTAAPVVGLGEPGAFDDTHVFAPCVASEGGPFRMWYCGSTGAVAERVFHLGLATSGDGKVFQRAATSPVYSFGDGKHSVLTPALLRSADGAVLRDGERLRMWFCSTDFSVVGGPHTLHETFSTDGVHWSAPSKPLLEHVYAPTILQEGAAYRMWYVDVSSEPWILRYAESGDGSRWAVRPEPVLTLDQDWEKARLFYPTVVKADGAYLMWYGSYWREQPDKTAIGFAVSLDGWRWYKHPQNPVLRPDPARPWESHYTTSQSVLRLADGSWRMWYASRKKPPFTNMYFAINTARWRGPDKAELPASLVLDPQRLAAKPGRAAFAAWQEETRAGLRRMLGIPSDRVALEPESRGQAELGDIVVEKWVYTSEPGSRVPAVLYRPRKAEGRLPAVVLTFGHGGSKSQPSYQYIGQLYARLGIVCLAADPIGEEERHRTAQRGTRAHDPYPVHRQAWDAGRPIMGKLVFDTLRGVDLLLTRSDVAPNHIGVAGNSLGGAKAGWMAVLDGRLSFAIVSGWAFADVVLRSKHCTSAPNERMREGLRWDEYLALAAPKCALLVMNGTADVIIDRDADGSAWSETRRAVASAERVYAALGRPGGIECWFEPRGGHRPYPAHRAALKWLARHASPDGLTEERLAALPDLHFGDWARKHGIQFEALYGTPLHLRGATVVDMGIAPLASLAVLKPEEVGRPEFTLEGWLKRIAGAKEH
ncbi:MAG TPA: acetylxylan esterase [Planctomycetota bacterium]|nr:acetylxylan esterase [Planctomycetota bacterium]